MSQLDLLPEKAEKIFKVSEFNEFINLYLEGAGEVTVEGEISQFRVNQGKWVFITIKDEDASVEVFGMTFQLGNVSALEEGMLVHVHGKPRLYKKSGRFSIFADTVIPAGQGALQAAFEKLKKKLEREGIFAPERKRPLPPFPEKIGLITAKNSEAYADFVKVLKSRIGGIKIYFFPVQVQGKNSVPSILTAFEHFNTHLPDLDMLVLVRGGGSLEDLWSFNDEQVARAVFSSKIPVVVGVGHENDVTLADLAADLRASTPSNAAELISRDRRDMEARIDASLQYIDTVLKRNIEGRRHEVTRFINGLRNSLYGQLETFNALIRRFTGEFQIFKHRTEKLSLNTAYTESALFKQIRFFIQTYRERLEGTIRILQNLEYGKIISRGFSITFTSDGKVIKSARNLSINQKMETLLSDGKIYSSVTGKEE